VITDCYLNLSQAVLGGKVKIKTLYGDVDIPIEKGTQNGDKKKLSGYVYFNLYR
jgi:DnaJ-class molecular chaperone with C-terminal Zn finger domain